MAELRNRSWLEQYQAIIDRARQLGEFGSPEGGQTPFHRLMAAGASMLPRSLSELSPWPRPGETGVAATRSAMQRKLESVEQGGSWLPDIHEMTRDPQIQNMLLGGLMGLGGAKLFEPDIRAALTAGPPVEWPPQFAGWGNRRVPFAPHRVSAGPMPPGRAEYVSADPDVGTGRTHYHRPTMTTTFHKPRPVRRDSYGRIQHQPSGAYSGSLAGRQSLPKQFPRRFDAEGREMYNRETGEYLQPWEREPPNAVPPPDETLGPGGMGVMEAPSGPARFHGVPDSEIRKALDNIEEDIQEMRRLRPNDPRIQELQNEHRELFDEAMRRANIPPARPNPDLPGDHMFNEISEEGRLSRINEGLQRREPGSGIVDWARLEDGTPIPLGRGMLSQRVPPIHPELMRARERVRARQRAHEKKAAELQAPKEEGEKLGPLPSFRVGEEPTNIWSPVTRAREAQRQYEGDYHTLHEGPGEPLRFLSPEETRFYKSNPHIKPPEGTIKWPNELHGALREGQQEIRRLTDMELMKRYAALANDAGPNPEALGSGMAGFWMKQVANELKKRGIIPPGTRF